MMREDGKHSKQHDDEEELQILFEERMRYLTVAHVEPDLQLIGQGQLMCLRNIQDIHDYIGRIALLLSFLEL